jgi:lipopolysaccharide/colanic/teichoic acid biosynthesis glycosyltransferase
MFQAPAKPLNENTALLPRVTTRRVNHALKLVLDYALVLPTLILIAPLLLGIAVLIKLDSPGPVIYRRLVVGRKGRSFYAYKFRTMYIDGNARLMRDRNLWMEVLNGGDIDNDPRLTRIGRLLRRFGLDELPRLFNVLERTMSLVGPRMLTRGEMLKFGHRIDGYTDVMPGLTGLWQVRGHSRDLDERVQLESEYIHNWSVVADLHILFQSVLVAFAIA